jgi:threonine dehydratase
MVAIDYRDIKRAADVLTGVAHRTPVLSSRQANEISGAQVFFKCENFQRVGAFKFRGAYFALHNLDQSQKARGVIAYSSGNHAQAVALAGRLLKIKTTIVMPANAPPIKIAATREYGAQVILYDTLSQSRESVAAALVAQHGWALIPPFDHVDVMAGQGTAADELLAEVGPLDYLVVPVGGGGLIAGSAIAAKWHAPQCRVIGIEPQAANDAQQSFQQGKIVTIPVPDTIADGARTQAIGQLVLPILLQSVDAMLSVDDQALLRQMHFFAERMKMIVEPTGCLAAAAVLDRCLDFSGARVGVIVSGGNRVVL